MAATERIRAQLAAHPVVLYMKGTPELPMCGASARAVEALRRAGASRLHAVNVMADPEIRANLPRVSDWPGFPQLFVKGEWIGGADIMVELAEAGELKRIVSEAGSDAA